jgi:sulfate adenylyltransferase subunit 1
VENNKLNIKEYLDADERKSLLRLLTAGSVDDGKSTLIGRLLFDSKKLYEDQLQALERDSKRLGNAGAGEIDYALLLDGLKAEREEGITNDVAYRYFSTNQRKFIIADTPGHEQYTRNMITGGSTANLAIILVDARTGVITQTRRHTFLVSLLGIKHIVLAVNKMDLVDYSEEVFNKIKNEYLHLTAQLGIEDVTCFPLSAKVGDNVVEKSEKTPWFEGTSLLQYLETVPIDRDRNMNDFRFPVQYVLRPNLDFRGFSGKVASGIIRKGDTVMALPSKKTSRVKSIVTYEGELDYAFCPQCVTITLEDEIDISRGEMLVKPDNLPFIGRNIQTKLVWMDEEPMNRNKQFFLKIGTNTTRATINAVDYRIDINTMDQLEGKDFCLNEIGQVQITTAKTLFFDDYKQNRATGAFILIDPITNNTCAVGMIEKPINEEELLSEDLPTLDLKKLGIEPEHYEAIELAAKELSRQGIEIIIKK